MMRIPNRYTFVVRTFAAGHSLNNGYIFVQYSQPVGSFATRER
jgi:hypothetical protein